ncbi:hypothetical protein CRUP_024674 [Coryphaenoides rupestris]|nr:hypothetical protein CRUP_024674 [Coryphaenoides rupestris]
MAAEVADISLSTMSPSSSCRTSAPLGRSSWIRSGRGYRSGHGLTFPRLRILWTMMRMAAGSALWTLALAFRSLRKARLCVAQLRQFSVRPAASDGGGGGELGQVGADLRAGLRTRLQHECQSLLLFSRSACREDCCACADCRSDDSSASFSLTERIRRSFSACRPTMELLSSTPTWGTERTVRSWGDRST